MGTLRTIPHSTFSLSYQTHLEYTFSLVSVCIPCLQQSIVNGNTVCRGRYEHFI